MKLVVCYVLFAVLATAANLGSQFLTTRIAPTTLEPWLSMAVGTGIGLIVKYLLDKHFIFDANHLKRSTEIARSFLLYSLSGLFTTLFFWGLELAFLHGFPSWAAARYVGGAIGLAAGYTVKYRLDRRYAFA